MRVVIGFMFVVLVASPVMAQLVGTGGIGYGPNLPATCSPGDVFAASTSPSLSICSAANTWTTLAPASAAVPTGTVVMITSGACPTGYAEVAALNGKMLRGTLAANGNVGTTGGSDSATPTVATLTAAAQTFTGSQGTTNAVSAGTPAGTNGTVTFTPQGTNGTGTVTPAGTIAWPAGVPTNANGAFTDGAISWPAGVPTFSGAALAAHAHELPWQIPSTTTIRQIAVATFGTGTSRAATAVSAAGTANTTSAAVALSEAKSAGTPAGTVAWPAGVPTIAAGVFTQPTIAWPAGVPAFSGSSSTTSAQTFTGTQGTVPAQTFTGSALGTHQHTLTPTGTNGTSAVTGTLNAISTIPSFVYVIFCAKS